MLLVSLATDISLLFRPIDIVDMEAFGHKAGRGRRL
jgi:hypothetical protein